MSILIKGMEMPTSCSVCPMLEGDRMDGLCHAASRWLDDDEYWTWYVYPEGDMDDSKPCNCPLVPVPSHGRRVVYRGDVYNAIEEKRIKTLDRVLNDRYIDGVHDGLKQALFALATVEDAPTIIEAEGGE